MMSWKRSISRAEVALMIILGWVSPVWASGSGVLTVTAKITSPTCAIGVNGSSNAVISLPDAATGDFKNTSDTLNRTPFTIDLSGCADVAPGALKVIITRPAGVKTDASMPATSGTAADSIEFNFFSVAGSAPSPAWAFAGGDATFAVPNMTNGKVSMPYTVGYRAAKLPITAGTVVGTFKVALVYK